MDEQFILKHVRTNEERGELIEITEVLLEDIFKKPGTSHDFSQESAFTKNAYTAIYSVLQSRGILNNRSEAEKFLDSLLSKSKEMDEIRISIAFSPTEELIQILKSWAEKNKSGNVIFDITIDKTILGGAVIASSEGEYANYSLFKMMDKILLNEKQQIMALL